jgi:hypothetical protein
MRPSGIFQAAFCLLKYRDGLLIQTPGQKNGWPYEKNIIFRFTISAGNATMIDDMLS